MVAKRNNIKVFIASTVFNFQRELEQIYTLLDEFGYDVLMSHKGTLPLDSNESNLVNCLEGVEECDVFLGFIRPDYGSGVLDRGGLSITHQEFHKAFERGILRFVLADHRVVFTRSLFKDSYFIDNNTRQPINFTNVSFENCKIMDARCIVMYNEAILDSVKPASKRIGNWVQEYVNFDNITLYLDSQFKYPERIKKLLDKSKELEREKKAIKNSQMDIKEASNSKKSKKEEK